MAILPVICARRLPGLCEILPAALHKTKMAAGECQAAKVYALSRALVARACCTWFTDGTHTTRLFELEAARNGIGLIAYASQLVT